MVKIYIIILIKLCLNTIPSDVWNENNLVIFTATSQSHDNLVQDFVFTSSAGHENSPGRNIKYFKIFQIFFIFIMHIFDLNKTCLSLSLLHHDMEVIQAQNKSLESTVEKALWMINIASVSVSFISNQMSKLWLNDKF